MITCKNHPNRKAIKGEEICSSCRTKEKMQNDPEFHQKKKDYCSNWQKLNKERRKEYMDQRREYYLANEKDNPEHKLRRRNQRLLQTYGITNEDYSKQLEYQGNKCAICRKGCTPGRYFHIDHCHDTGRFRGLLCHQCNWYLGLIDADPEMKVRLTMYGTTTKEIHPDIKQVKEHGRYKDPKKEQK
jgi:hypothetical protein